MKSPNDGFAVEPESQPAYSGAAEAPSPDYSRLPGDAQSGLMREANGYIRTFCNAISNATGGAVGYFLKQFQQIPTSDTLIAETENIPMAGHTLIVAGVTVNNSAYLFIRTSLNGVFTTDWIALMDTRNVAAIGLNPTVGLAGSFTTTVQPLVNVPRVENLVLKVRFDKVHFAFYSAGLGAAVNLVSASGEASVQI